MSKLKGIVQWLGDVREVWAKGKFCDYVRQVHHYRTGQLSLLPNREIGRTAMVNMLMASITVTKGCDVQIG